MAHLWHYPLPAHFPHLTTSIVAEVLGSLFFTLMALTTKDPLALGLSFAAAVYLSAHHSGGHANPAVTLTGTFSGRVSWNRLASYWGAQLVGALVAACLLVYLVPGYSFGAGTDVSCRVPLPELAGTPLYLWETLLTFLLTSVVFGATFKSPGLGPVGPLAAGFTLAACVATGGQYTGASVLNPAVTLASAIVFKCWSQSWVYLLGQLTGGALAASLMIGYYGKGPLFTGRHEEDYQGAANEGSPGRAAAEPAGAGGYTPLMGGGTGV